VEEENGDILGTGLRRELLRIAALGSKNEGEKVKARLLLLLQSVAN